VGSPQKLLEREEEHEGIHRGGLMYPPQGQLPVRECFDAFTSLFHVLKLYIIYQDVSQG